MIWFLYFFYLMTWNVIFVIFKTFQHQLFLITIQKNYYKRMNFLIEYFSLKKNKVSPFFFCDICHCPNWPLKLQNRIFIETATNFVLHSEQGELKRFINLFFCSPLNCLFFMHEKFFFSVVLFFFHSKPSSWD